MAIDVSFSPPSVRPAFGRVMVFPLQIKSASDQAFEGWASTPAVDREGEVILPEALAASLQQYMENPIVTYAHDWLNPIGRTVEARASDAGLWVRIQLGRTARAREVWQLVEDRILRSLSIGFNADPADGFERDGIWYWRRIELLEISIVPIPANPQARITISRQLGLEPSAPLHAKSRGPERVRGVTPYAGLPLAPEDTPWQWDVRAQNAVLGDPPDWDRYRRAHFWYDPLRPQSKASYKLPFAKIIDGELHAVWRGVAAAMAALLGARGGVDIPPQDRRAVYEHICRYYERFGKQPPQFRGEWPEHLRAVRFFNDELEIFAEAYVAGAAAEIARLARDAAGMIRHWRKTGRKPPQLVVDMLGRARGDLTATLTEASRAAARAADQASSQARQLSFDAAEIDPDRLAHELVKHLDATTLAALLTAARK